MTSRRFAAVLIAIGALAVSAPVAGASAATTPPTQPAPSNPFAVGLTAAQDAFAVGAAAAQSGFAAGAAATQSGATVLRDTWTSALSALGIGPVGIGPAGIGRLGIGPHRHMLGPNIAPQP